MEFTIRRALPADWPALKAIRLRALQASPLAFGSTYGREVAFDTATWRERIESTITLLARRGNQVVAMATGFPDPDDETTMKLFGMYVEPAARGLGLAGALVDAVVTAGREQGRPRILLHVVVDNLVARGLYERRGFVATGRSAGLPHTPDVREIELELSPLPSEMPRR